MTQTPGYTRAENRPSEWCQRAVKALYSPPPQFLISQAKKSRQHSHHTHRGDSTGSWEAPLQSHQRSSVCGGWGWGDQGPSQSRCQEESEATEPPLSTLRAAGPHIDVRPSPSELLPSSKSTDPGQDSGSPCRICPPPWKTRLTSASGKRNRKTLKP